ncbi:MAG: hypothetical protein HOO89_11485 [Ferruginibacter sp.]|nr:hypothetical protein [Ferruginibacter sp.]
MLKIIDSTFTNGKTKTCNNLVLLAHDRTFQEPEDSASLHKLIIELKKKNEYDFEFVSKYPSINTDTLLSK